MKIRKKDENESRKIIFPLAPKLDMAIYGESPARKGRPVEQHARSHNKREVGFEFH